jgi:Tfp pilus assembly protein PilW
MLVAVSVASLVLGTATVLLSTLTTLNKRVENEVSAQEKARTAIDALAAQLRNGVGPPGQPPVYYPAGGSTAATTELVFWAPIASANTSNNPRGLQWVRYCLDYANVNDETLWKQTATYDASQPVAPSTSTCPNAAWSTQQTVATSVVNRAGTPVTPLFTPALDGSGVIQDIQVRLLVKGDAARTPTPVTSSIHFRNAKSAPSAVLTCNAQNGHAVCDASRSTDPDGEAIAFQWKYRCCSPGFTGGDTNWETGQTSYLFDKGGLTSGQTYAIDVQVTDASGLATTATTQVTMP